MAGITPPIILEERKKKTINPRRRISPWSLPQCSTLDQSECLQSGPYGFSFCEYHTGIGCRPTPSSRSDTAEIYRVLNYLLSKGIKETDIMKVAIKILEKNNTPYQLK